MFDWLYHPANDDSTITVWLAGLVIILIISFLWSTVIKSMVE